MCATTTPLLECYQVETLRHSHSLEQNNNSRHDGGGGGGGGGPEPGVVEGTACVVINKPMRAREADM